MRVAKLSLSEDSGLSLSALHGLLYYFYTGDPTRFTPADAEVVLYLADFFELDTGESGEPQPLLAYCSSLIN